MSTPARRICRTGRVSRVFKLLAGLAAAVVPAIGMYVGRRHFAVDAFCFLYFLVVLLAAVALRSWLIISTLLGAFLGSYFQPAVVSGDREWAAWVNAFRLIGWTIAGTVAGFLIDQRRRRNPPNAK
ncbi:MAG: hypothetical protein ACKV0T_01475 [Planctomycetales bacterium]